MWASKPAIIAYLEAAPAVNARRGWRGPTLASSQGSADEPSTDDDAGDAAAAEPLQPVGLTNLGATCYLNALLQVLFHCVPFRAGVYRFARPGAADAWAVAPSAQAEAGAAIVWELQKVFARLDDGSMGAVADVEDLVALLKFDRGYQQDPVECWKLLSGPIEAAFKASADPSLENLFDQVRIPRTTAFTCGQMNARISWSPRTAPLCVEGCPT